MNADQPDSKIAMKADSNNLIKTMTYIPPTYLILSALIRVHRRLKKVFEIIIHARKSTLAPPHSYQTNSRNSSFYRRSSALIGG